MTALGAKIPKDWGDRPPTDAPARPVTYAHVVPHVGVCSTHPILTPDAVFVHTLGTQPLESQQGKKIHAKELGLWHGRGAPAGVEPYYAHGARKYLALDGTPLGGISLCEKEGYHNGRFVKAKVAILAAMAAATGRTLLLPRVLVDYHTYFLWTFLDLQSLGDGVDVRETNFLHNPRARAAPDAPMASVARVALGRGKVAGAVGADGAGPAWAALDPDQDVVDHWAAALEPHAAAELLLVNLDFVDGEFVAVLTNCAPDARKQCLRRVGVPPEFVDFFERLRWCGETVDLNKMATKSFQGFDCFAKGRPHKMAK